MRNLKVLLSTITDLRADVVGQCIDADNKRLFFVLSDLSVYKIDNDSSVPQRVNHELKTESILGKVSIEHYEVILVEYIVETGCILVVLKNGTTLQLAVSSFSQNSCRLYDHKKEVSSVKISPSQDLVALSDSDNKISIYTIDFSDLINRDDALLQNESLIKPVGVGWGSKETQFFGLDGRPSKEKEDKNKIVLSDEDLARVNQIESSKIFKEFNQKKERSTTLDWRGDGQLLASLTYIPETDKHYLKIWNRNLELQYMSEQLVTIERGILCWIPNGQYACCAQRRDKRVNEVAMFEKNGMVHQRVNLPNFLVDMYIQELAWSHDSNMLAIIAAKFEIDSQSSNIAKRYILFLYTMQNFHYYLKFSTYIDDQTQDASVSFSLRWNPINNNILYIWSSKGRCYQLDNASVIDYSLRDSTIFVQDTNRLLITPLAICNVPPPMCAIELELDQVISRIVVNPEAECSLYVITIDDKLYYTRESEQPKNILQIRPHLPSQAIKRLSDSRLECRFHKLTLPDAHLYQNLTPHPKYFMVASRQLNEVYELVILQPSSLKFDLLEPIVKLTSNQQIISIIAKNESTYYITEDSTCTHVDLSSGSTKVMFDLKSIGIDRLHILDNKVLTPKGHPDGEHKIILLSQELTLCVDNNLLIANSCSSFRLTDNFLVYTTTDNTLNFVPIRWVYEKRGSEPLNSWSQPIENGGKLVIASEDDSKVVLQMPRGNLEILHPRILVLSEIIRNLNCERYLDAVKLAKRHRVDLNFINDYLMREETENFLLKLTKLVMQVAECDSSLLNLFINDLNKDDTITGRYKETMRYIEDSTISLDHEPDFTNKINTICCAPVWESGCRSLEPRLLTLLKRDPRRADLALEIIHKLDRGPKEAAMKFMTYFVSIDQLYIDALSTYDIDIALMVAESSSKDPKEYLALLDTFNEISNTHLRRYKIDLHTKQYKKAIVNALKFFEAIDHDDNITTQEDKSGFREEILDLLVSRSLYKSAIEYCSDSDAVNLNLKLDIYSKYASYLFTKRHFIEASLIYTKAINLAQTKEVQIELYNGALKSMLIYDDWERTLALIQKFSEPLGGNRSEHLRQLSENMMMQGKAPEAVLVSSAIRDSRHTNALIKATRWHLAEALGPEKPGSDFYRDITSSIDDEFANFETLLRERTSTARSQFSRLQEIFKKGPTIRHAHIMLNADNCAVGDTLSTVDGSELSSLASGSQIGREHSKKGRSNASSIKTKASSSKSSKSSADRKKKIQLKHESRYEDLAIVLELKKFVESQKSFQEQAIHFHASRLYFDHDYKLRSSSNWSREPLVDLVIESYELAKEICKKLWPRNKEAQQEDSLYIRFIKRLDTEELYENVDFEVLVAPDLPRQVSFLEF